MIRATVIVLSWNGADHLPACLAALREQEAGPVDLLVVDNGSTDNSLAMVQQHFPQAEIIANGRNLGFSAGMNVGLRQLRQRPEPPGVAVLLNQDTVVAPDWLGHLLAPFAEDERIAAVGCKIYYPDGQTIQHAGKWMEPGRAMTHHFGYRERDVGQYDQPRDVEAVTGAALALRLSALDAVGCFDEGYSPAYYEDDDLCWRLRRVGYHIRYVPTATLRHHESTSIADLVRRSTLMNRNRLRFVVKTFPAQRIWEDFLLAERARMALLEHGGEARSLRRAYFEGILHSAEWITARRAFYTVDAAEAQQLRQLCVDLRRAMATFDQQR